ncbi:unnamed protein product, partial [Amoebophrya sp. A25]|eukprot:GSA25T00026915001.1
MVKTLRNIARLFKDLHESPDSTKETVARFFAHQTLGSLDQVRADLMIKKGGRQFWVAVHSSSSSTVSSSLVDGGGGYHRRDQTTLQSQIHPQRQAKFLRKFCSDKMEQFPATAWFAKQMLDIGRSIGRSIGMKLCPSRMAPDHLDCIFLPHPSAFGTISREPAYCTSPNALRDIIAANNQ